MKKRILKFLHKFINALSKAIYKIFGFWLKFIFGLLVLLGLFVLPIFLYFSKDLPDYNQLIDYDPPTITRIYSSEGDLMTELAIERRIFQKIDEIPQLLINAFIAAEDQNYYHHPGIDLYSIIRAAFQNLLNVGSERNPVGGSTITQQVVKNFLLNNEKSLSRKIKEAILAYRINKVYSKERILELYLNQIYLGNGAYGVTSAALAYFNKDLKDLTIEEIAMLAALPKAPSHLDPTHHVDKTKARRNWVLERMREEHFITEKEAHDAQAKPIILKPRFESSILDSGYYTESVRLNLIDKYGADHIYQDGYSIYTNLNKKFQKYADEALREGLIDYDKRHGYKGPLQNIKFKGDEWKTILKSLEKPAALGVLEVAIVLDVSDQSATIGLSNGTRGIIPFANLSWARKRLLEGYIGKKVERASDVVKIGDIIIVDYNNENKAYSLEQIPDVNGALVAIENFTGKVVAMSGGYSFKGSKYNRALQALRQPGSAFKPLVYLSALDKGYTPRSIINDEPISIFQGPNLPPWTPKNYEGNFLGPITLRKALEKSRNLATVHLIKEIGPKIVAETALKLHVYDSLPPFRYSMALGAMETTLMKLTSAFATFASNGQLVEGKLIDRIQDRKGNLLYTSDSRKCEACFLSEEVKNVSEDPNLTHVVNNVIDPLINYQLVSMLEGAVTRGTAIRARQLNRVVAGKTGTSNDSNDTWFIGFTPEITVGVFVGYDSPKTLGKREQGSSVALPIFIKFMQKAKDDIPNREFFIPPGINFITADADTGEDAGFSLSGKGIVKEPVKPTDMKNHMGNDEAGSEGEAKEDSVSFNGNIIY